MQVSVGQQAANALATYLRQTLSGDVVVYSHWPKGPDLPERVVSIIPVGRRTRGDEYGTLEFVDQTNLQPASLSAGQTATVTIKTGEQTQPIQLDIWCTTFDGRDDIIAQLDQLLYQGPVTTMNVPGSTQVVYSDPVIDELVLPFDQANSVNPSPYAGQTVAYQFDDCSIDDTPDSIQRDEYRAIFLGEARMAKTVFRTVPITSNVGLEYTVSMEPLPAVPGTPFVPDFTAKPAKPAT